MPVYILMKYGEMELRYLLRYVLVIFGTVMLILSSYGFEETQAKTRMVSERVKSMTIFMRKFLSYLGLSALFIALGLLIGIIGYHWAAGLSWLDALVEASMILSGMGPINPLLTTSAKVFASLYALFSGLVFVLAMGIVLSPLMYSLLSQFQIKLKKTNEEEGEQQSKEQAQNPTTSSLSTLETNCPKTRGGRDV